MKWIVLFFLLVCLVGCTPYQKQAGGVLLKDAKHELLKSESNGTIDKMSFTIKNQGDFNVDCAVLINQSNITDLSVKRAHIGLIGSGKEKRVALRIKMLEGKSEISIGSECHML
jgi:hypothetical protein